MKKIILLCLIVSLSGCMKSCDSALPHIKIPPELMQKPEPLQKL